MGHYQLLNRKLRRAGVSGKHFIQTLYAGEMFESFPRLEMWGALVMSTGYEEAGEEPAMLLVRAHTCSEGRECNSFSRGKAIVVVLKIWLWFPN